MKYLNFWFDNYLLELIIFINKSNLEYDLVG